MCGVKPTVSDKSQYSKQLCGVDATMSPQSIEGEMLILQDGSYWIPGAWISQRRTSGSLHPLSSWKPLSFHGMRNEWRFSDAHCKNKALESNKSPPWMLPAEKTFSASEAEAHPTAYEHQRHQQSSQQVYPQELLDDRKQVRHRQVSSTRVSATVSNTIISETA
jgi:hypothetical protein